ncbi:AP2/ERF domain-containing protein [Artemisia annua]|uniref:AP2/ERF domain-containing protein n=1 Tax=Artemisia annua TaxID=35608 RepID=A0A2U1KRU9_ARTAN|nr:AP2/ERF domain-containing protein [Artemisia annua]
MHNMQSNFIRNQLSYTFESFKTSTNHRCSLTVDEEHSIIVSTLKNVISGHTDTPITSSLLIPSTSGTHNTNNKISLLSEHPVEVCQVCGIIGCLGCNFFWQNAPACDGGAQQKGGGCGYDIADFVEIEFLGEQLYYWVYTGTDVYSYCDKRLKLSRRYPSGSLQTECRRLGDSDNPEVSLCAFKAALCRCNIFPVVVTHVVEGMTHNLRPTCAEATDGANVVLDGQYLDNKSSKLQEVMQFFLVLRLCVDYPVETICIVGKICAEDLTHSYMMKMNYITTYLTLHARIETHVWVKMGHF